MTEHDPALPVIAVTGANGYVGSIIVRGLGERARIVRLVRRPTRSEDVAWSFDSGTAALADSLRQRGVTHLIHAAWDMSTSSLSTLRSRCVEGSRRLFEAARLAGVDTVIFISSISAFEGARSAYGLAKLEVEKQAQQAGGIVLRLGLVWGQPDGGMYGKMQSMVHKGGLLPLIGDGSQPQYLLPEALLVRTIERAVSGELARPGQLLTIAEPAPVTFRELLLRIASDEGKPLRLLPIPWPLIYLPLRAAELAGLQPKFRSDSILSFIYQNPSPQISSP